jgi:hypothetical protein
MTEKVAAKAIGTQSIAGGMAMLAMQLSGNQEPVRLRQCGANTYVADLV